MKCSSSVAAIIFMFFGFVRVYFRCGISLRIPERPHAEQNMYRFRMERHLGHHLAGALTCCFFLPLLPEVFDWVVVDDNIMISTERSRRCAWDLVGLTPRSFRLWATEKESTAGFAASTQKERHNNNKRLTSSPLCFPTFFIASDELTIQVKKEEIDLPIPWNCGRIASTQRLHKVNYFAWFDNNKTYEMLFLFENKEMHRISERFKHKGWRRRSREKLAGSSLKCTNLFEWVDLFVSIFNEQSAKALTWELGVFGTWYHQYSTSK